MFSGNTLRLNQIKIVKKFGDCNSFYKCLIIDWINNNYENYLTFFGEDDKNRISKRRNSQK